MTKVNREFSADVKAIIRRRCGSRCEFPDCRLLGVHFHHRLTRSHGGLGTPANGLLLCNSHHEYVHAHPAESYENGWLIRSGVDAG